MAYNSRFPGGSSNQNRPQQNPGGVPFGQQAGPHPYHPHGAPQGMYGYIPPQQQAAQGYQGGFVQGYPAANHRAPNHHQMQQQAFQHQQKMFQQQQKLAESNQKKQAEARKRQEFEVQQRRLQAFGKSGSKKTASGDLSHLIGPLAQRSGGLATSATKQQSAKSSIFYRPGGTYNAQHAGIPPSQTFHGQHATPPQSYGPQATQPQSYGPQATQPQSYEPQATQLQSFGPQATQPQSFGPQATQPQSFGPQATQAQSFGPQATQAQSFGPQATQAQSYGPQATQPQSFGPQASQMQSYMPQATQAQSHGPHATQAKSFGLQATHDNDFGEFKEGSSSNDEVFSDFQEATAATAPVGNVPLSQAGQWTNSASTAVSHPHMTTSWQGNQVSGAHTGTSFRQGNGVPGQMSTWSGASVVSGPSFMAPTESALGHEQRLRTDSMSSVSSTSSGGGAAMGMPPHQHVGVGGQYGGFPGQTMQSFGVTSSRQALTFSTAQIPGGAVGLPGGAVGVPGGAVGVPGGAVGLPGGAVGLPGSMPQMPGSMQHFQGGVPPSHGGPAPDHEEPLEEHKERTPKDVYGVNPPHWCDEGANLPRVYADVAEKVITIDGSVDTGILYPILLASGLSRDILGMVWAQVNKENPGQLNQLELKMMLGLVALGQTGIKPERLTLEKLATCQTAPLPSFTEEVLQEKSSGWSFDAGNQKAPSSQQDPSFNQHQGLQPSITSDLPPDPNDKYSVFKMASSQPQPMGDHIAAGPGWAPMAQGISITTPKIPPSSDQDFGDFQGDHGSEFSNFQGGTSGADFGVFQESGLSQSSSFHTSVGSQSGHTIASTASTFSTMQLQGTDTASSLNSGLQTAMDSISMLSVSSGSSYVGQQIVASPQAPSASQAAFPQAAQTTSLDQFSSLSSSTMTSSSASTPLDLFASFSSATTGSPTTTSVSSAQVASDILNSLSLPMAPSSTGAESASFGDFASFPTSSSSSSALVAPAATDSVTNIENLSMASTKVDSTDDFADFMTAEPIIDASSHKEKEPVAIAQDSGVIPKLNFPIGDSTISKDSSFTGFPKIKMPIDNISIPSIPGTEANKIVSKAETLVGANISITATAVSDESSKGTGDKYDFLRDLGSMSVTTDIFSQPEKETHRKKEDSFGNFDAFQSAETTEAGEDFGSFNDFQSSPAPANNVNSFPKFLEAPSITHPVSHQFAHFETTQTTSLNELNKFELHPSAHGNDALQTNDDFGDFENFETAKPEIPQSTIDNFGDFSNFQASTTAPIPPTDKQTPVKQGDALFASVAAPQPGFPSTTVGAADSKGIGGSGSSVFGSMAGDDHDAEHNLINAVPLDTAQRYKSLSSGSEDVDKHASLWGQCLNSCLLTIATGALAVQRMQDPTIRQEVLQSKQGIEYFTALNEVFTVTQRINVSVKKTARNNMKLQDILQEIGQSWKSIANFLSGSSVDTSVADFSDLHVTGNEDKRLACGLCLLNTSKTSQESSDGTTKVSDAIINYGARQYHATCANFWCNRVDSILPSLFPVYSLI